MGRAIIAVTVAIIMIFTMTACGKNDKQKVADNKGQMLKLEKIEVTENGFYVRDKKNDIYTPVMTQFEQGGNISDLSSTNIQSYEGFSSGEEESGQFPHLWLGQKNYDPSKLIPVVDGKRTELVMWYDGNSEMPEQYTISRCKRLGYTLGIHITFGETSNQLFLDSEDYCGTSDASKLTKNMSEGLNRINKINNSKKLPLQNIDTDVNMLLGLEKNKEYTIAYFDGTQLQEEGVLADTLAFKVMDIEKLESPFDITEEDYFVINFPENLKAGYYLINGTGLFKYQPQ